MKKTIIIALTATIGLVSCGSDENKEVNIVNDEVLSQQQIEELSTTEAENELLEQNLEDMKSEAEELETLLETL